MLRKSMHTQQIQKGQQMNTKHPNLNLLSSLNLLEQYARGHGYAR